MIQIRKHFIYASRKSTPHAFQLFLIVTPKRAGHATDSPPQLYLTNSKVVISSH